jgi:hypothetical protein
MAIPGHIRMDLDQPRTFPIAVEMRAQVIAQINLDASLLAKHNVMDYSLLVGVVVKDVDPTENDGKKKKKSKKRKKSKESVDEELGKEQVNPNSDLIFSSVWQNGLPSASFPAEHYMFGIIDILQDYNTFKKSAHIFKVIVYRTSVR